MKTKVKTVLLAGGKGTRLWPLSTARLSKAYINIGKNKAMISRSLERAVRLTGKANTHIVVDKDQYSQLKKFTDPVVKKNIIVEPFGRSTASAIGLAALQMLPDEIMLIMPTDSFIKDDKKFYETINKGISFARKSTHALICVGIVPDRPSTAYGYIKIADEISDGVYSVDRFVEKPSRKKASSLVKNKSYLWNAGIFIFRVEAILKTMQRHSPALFDGLQQIKKNRKDIAKVYARMKNVSIDYQIMEKAQNLYCIKGSFTWRDLGNWQNVGKLFKKDKCGNEIFGKAVLLDTRNSVIYNSEGKTVGVNGLSEVIVINTKNGILVSSKNDVENVKKIALLTERENENIVS